ncbi:MalY/PatB family protein [Brevibacillus sp. B_LB10_24]|uniref:MalY/PatB family protein n=1 Tax=Brevibacillus sp. B_LB10_24 TaxID=3380645 RepID=UPI0038BBA077
MRYDFDKQINRFQTASEKWDQLEEHFGDKDLLPMWVADMDFASPEPVIEAIKQRAEHGIFGYTVISDEYLDAVVNWMQVRHDWAIQKDWVCHSPGVVPALHFIVQSFTQPGDKVMFQPPVYYPFSKVIANNGREIVYNPLKYENGRYQMDLDDLRKKIAGVKLLILCSPHNPVGRVWTKEELAELGRICLEHNVLVVSDEIHFDLVLSGHTHTPFAAISEEFAQNAIICTAPSKTFNLAGLQISNIIIPNQKLRKVFADTVDKHFLGLPGTFGLVAAESAYRHGGEWLDQLLAYLEQNLDFLTAYLQQNLPELKVIKPEGTYLVWVDCRGLGLSLKELEQFMLQKAKVAFNQGYVFGPGGEGFIRINIACPRSLLEEGLSRVSAAMRSLKKG